jgi:uncharacterized protein
VLPNVPGFATFTHAGAREGFEVVCFRPGAGADRLILEGGTAAIEDGNPWSVHYRVAVDGGWGTTGVEAVGISPSGHHTLNAERRAGRWTVNGIERPDLDECIDVDFESSLATNTLPVHRINLDATTLVHVPAAFVHADDLRVDRVEQTYLCTERTADRIVVDYASATFDYSGRLVFDGSGLVTEYPGLGHRHR